jgi:MFS transporter, FSR family, fosmidomycin resistance protein
VSTAVSADPDRPAEEAPASGTGRRALVVASGAHALHDGYTDLVWIGLPIWQAEFGLSYAAVGMLRMIYTGTMASLQIPASHLAERVGGRIVLALGTALCGLCYCLAGLGTDVWWLAAALFLGGLGAATQHPIGSALVTRAFTGARALTAFGTYNFAGDVGKVLLPAAAATLILFMPWRPAYGLLGLMGLAAAVAIFVLTPRLSAAITTAPKVSMRDSDATAHSANVRFGFRVLAGLGIADSIVRGAFFVLLPFLLIGKGATPATAGLALTLVFVGGAAGKLAFGWVARWLGLVSTIVVAQAVAAAGMLAVLLVPLIPALALLPLVGVALNGGTTVIYGSVPSYAAPEKRTHALSVFYTATIGSAAISPPLSGLLGDLVGIFNAIVVVVILTLLTVPVAGLLRNRTVAVS